MEFLCLHTLTKGGIKEILKNNIDGIILNKSKNKLQLRNAIFKIKKNYKYFSRNSFLNSKKFDSKINIKKLINNELLN